MTVTYIAGDQASGTLDGTESTPFTHSGLRFACDLAKGAADRRPDLRLHLVLEGGGEAAAARESRSFPSASAAAVLTSFFLSASSGRIGSTAWVTDLPSDQAAPRRTPAVMVSEER